MGIKKEGQSKDSAHNKTSVGWMRQYMTLFEPCKRVFYVTNLDDVKYRKKEYYILELYPEEIRLKQYASQKKIEMVWNIRLDELHIDSRLVDDAFKPQFENAIKKIEADIKSDEAVVIEKEKKG